MKSQNNQSPDILLENSTPEKVAKNMNKYNFENITNVHEVKIAINTLMKKFEELGLPAFIAVYVGSEGKNDGYLYDTVLPEEIGKDTCPSQYGRFLKFLQIVIDFNKEDYIPTISLKN